MTYERSEVDKDLLAEAIRARLDALEWNQEDLAREIGVTQQAVSGWLNGSAPNKKSWEKLSAALGIDFSDVQKEGGVNVATTLPSEVDGAPRPKAHYLSMYELDVTAGAGSHGGVAVSEMPVGLYIIDRTEIESLYDHKPTRPFVVTVIGESMEPEFRDGDRVIIEPNTWGEKEIRTSAIYLFRLEDVIEIKQIQRLPGAVLRVSARNPLYAPYEIDIQHTDFEIIGRVWGRFKRY